MKELKDLINEKLTVSLRQFEKEVGVTRQTIMNILSGKHTPKITTVKRICDYFKVDYREYSFARVVYLCDRTKCKECKDYCKHTEDITHAVNFKLLGGEYWESEKKEDK